NREEVYTSLAANGSNSFHLFDRAKLNIGGSKKYEVCDILTDKKEFIHIKRHQSGASSINHIFTQGRFYSLAFSTDDECRKSIINWINTNTLPENSTKDKAKFTALIPEKNDQIVENEYHIVFCLLHDSET